MSMTMTLTVKTKFDYFMSPCAVHRLVFFMQTFRQRPTLQPAFTASQSHTHSLTPTVSISDELYHSVTSYLGISCPDKLHQSSLKPATKLQLLLVLHSVTVSVNAILTNDNVTNVINTIIATVLLYPSLPQGKKEEEKRHIQYTQLFKFKHLRSDCNSFHSFTALTVSQSRNGNCAVYHYQ